MNKTNRKGFTLAELLIVVAIIAVLVAIAIPVFTKQLHNARVAADQANLRAYYAELQLDFQETGKVNDMFAGKEEYPSLNEIKHLDGTTTKLQAGTYIFYAYKNKANYTNTTGYSIIYSCNNKPLPHPDHSKVFSN